MTVQTHPTSPYESAVPAGYSLFSAGTFSVLMHRRGAIAMLILLAALFFVAIASLTIGTAALSPLDAVLAIAGQGSGMNVFLVQELRLPRLLAGILSGAAFGVGGCLLQTLARNRLATPGIIGIDDGASAFAIASIIAVPTSMAPSALALIGAATAAALVFGLGGGVGSRGYRFIVVGIAIGAVFGALTNLMLARTNIDSANLAYPWTVGSLNARPAEAVWALAAGLLICLPVSKYLGRALNMMRLSEPVAVALGVRLSMTRGLTLLVTVVLTALGVAVVGPVGLIALAAPEVARHLAGHQGVPVLTSGLAGAVLMTAADWAGRSVFTPIEIPVGIIAAVVGGPYLLWILLRQPSRRIG